MEDVVATLENFQVDRTRDVHRVQTDGTRLFRLATHLPERAYAILSRRRRRVGED